MNTEKVYYQLSEPQKSIWYLEKAYPGTSLNIVAGTLRLKGCVSYTALEKAINVFVMKNESMRLRICEADGTALQYVTEHETFKVDYFDFSKRGGLKDLFVWDEETTRTPFDIVENRLFYCALFKVSDDEGGFYMKMHHLISDAWTMGLTTRQVVDLYTKIKNGEPADDTLNPSFVEHLQSDEEYEKSGRFEKDKAYWTDKFKDLPETTILKPKKSGENKIDAKRKTLVTPLKLSAKIREFCVENNVSPFTLFMSALSIYINRVTGIEDLVLGTTILNRTSRREKETTGMFISVAAPVRITVSDSMDFRTFAKAMLKENTDILRHQKYPYNYLVKDLKKTHKFSNRLFDIVLSYQNSKFHKDEAQEEYVAKWLFSGSQVESLIISVNDRDDGGNLVIDYDFLTDVFDIREIEFIHQHIISLLWHALDNPARSISKLEMISAKEKHTILHDFNNTYADYPRDKTLHQMLEEQAEKTPDRTAVIFNNCKMTYAELNRKSNEMAHTLRTKGVGPDTIVGILTYRSFEMMIGIFGILKAGGAYMPIDPDYPAERKTYMLKNSSAGILLAERDLLAAIDFGGLVVDLNDEDSYSPDSENLPKINTPRDLAYVIYTSGSTGNPKGVMVEHAGVVNRINWMQKQYPLTEDRIIMQKTTYSFDVSVWELFWWSFVGASVCLISSGDEKDPEAIINTIEKYGITTIHFVPSMLSAFLYYVEGRHAESRLTSLKNVFASGEALTIHQVRLFNQMLYSSHGTLLSNLYGPTEATVDVSYFDCSPTPPLESVPIGKPIDNINLYIFDKNQNLLPVGIPGELYIGGIGVARGYLYNPDLTSEKFVINPYKRNEILYRTGDRARWYPKGDIEFLGRMDYQVKIRGFRIELGEIENRLMTHPDVKEAVVKAFSDDDNATWLAAFIVADKPHSAETLSSYLAETLPSYMVPGSVTFLDKMPQTANGKIDRKALPKPAHINSTDMLYTPPEGEAESILVDIWQKVLGIAQVGVLDDYIAIGGDSLNAIKIITEIHKRFGVDMSPRDVFQLKTIRRQAEHISSAGVSGVAIVGIEKAPLHKHYPVSSAQKRMYYLNEAGAGIGLNMTGGLIIEGRLDLDRLGEAFGMIIERHESLRTSFELSDEKPVQIIHQTVDFCVEKYDSNDDDYDALMDHFVRPFDLQVAPLFRLGLARVDENKHLLMIDMHHIISDGTSLNVMINEFIVLYYGGSLPVPGIQYKDYAVWHNALLQSERIEKQKDYWLSVFSEKIPDKYIELDFQRSDGFSYNGDKHYFVIDRPLTAKIKKLAADNNSTLYMVMLAALKLLLFRKTALEDLVVSMPIEGRVLSELQSLIGMFANILLIRSHPTADKTFDTYLAEIKETVLAAYENQDCPVDELVENLVRKWSLSRESMFDITFVLMSLELSRMSTRDFSAWPYKYNNKRSIRDLKLDANDMGSIITCFVEYSTDVFKAETIQALFADYITVLEKISEDPAVKIGEFRLTPTPKPKLIRKGASA